MPGFKAPDEGNKVLPLRSFFPIILKEDGRLNRISLIWFSIKDLFSSTTIIKSNPLEKFSMIDGSNGQGIAIFNKRIPNSSATFSFIFNFSSDCIKSR